MLQRFLAYFFAHWHLRRMPPGRDVETRATRARWCRDHCGTFAGRWLAVGIGAWLLQSIPFVAVLFPGALAWIPAIIALGGICLGIMHMVWQIAAQSRAGLPPVDPPVEVHPDRTAQRRREM